MTRFGWSTSVSRQQPRKGIDIETGQIVWRRVRVIESLMGGGDEQLEDYANKYQCGRFERRDGIL